jgi:hypothetical protein
MKPANFTRGTATWGSPADASSPWRLTLTRQLTVSGSLFSTPAHGRRRIAFVLLNPSTATETVNDPTITRCIGFARRWQFDELAVANIFAFRATDPADMLRAHRIHGHEYVVGPGNDQAIAACALGASMVIAAWGVLGSVGGRERAVAEIIRKTGRELHCLQKTKHGDPAHPLYLRADLQPEPWSPT